MSNAIEDFLQHKFFSSKEREKLVEKDQAMPGGSFPIRNRQDLKNAIQAYGRAKNKATAKAWIIKRAKELNLTDLLPDGWLEHSDAIGEVLEHHGVKGQKWGVRRSKRQLARASGKSVKDMSDEELKTAVARMNLEQQYSKLTSGSSSSFRGKAIAAGATFAGGLALNVARTQIQNQANAKIAAALAAKAAKKKAGL
jgi:hypothetical protein